MRKRPCPLRDAMGLIILPSTFQSGCQPHHQYKKLRENCNNFLRVELKAFKRFPLNNTDGNHLIPFACLFSCSLSCLTLNIIASAFSSAFINSDDSESPKIDRPFAILQREIALRTEGLTPSWLRFKTRSFFNWCLSNVISKSLCFNIRREYNSKIIAMQQKFLQK